MNLLRGKLAVGFVAANPWLSISGPSQQGPFALNRRMSAPDCQRPADKCIAKGRSTRLAAAQARLGCMTAPYPLGAHCDRKGSDGSQAPIETCPILEYIRTRPYL